MHKSMRIKVLAVSLLTTFGCEPEFSHVPSGSDGGDGRVADGGDGRVADGGGSRDAHVSDGGEEPDAGGTLDGALDEDASAPAGSSMFGPQSSDAHIRWGFDFVETFDGLADWVRDAGREGNVDDPARMPRLLDGGESAWGYYSVWSDTTPPQNWIDDYGDDRVWRGTRSAAIDIGGASGPSRLGLFMGEGYTDFHLFFMVRIPRNEFPTSCEGDSCRGGAVGTYTSGEPYAWFASWKFNTFNMGCESAMCPYRNTYSEHWYLIAHLEQYNYGSAPGITPHMEGQGEYSPNLWALDGERNLDDLLGDWMGLEYHVRSVGDEALFDVWVYEPDGTATQLLVDGRFVTPPAARGERWNQFFFGGNNSGTYSWGPTMESVYYIDDVIIDSDRIGPRYFATIRREDG